MILKLTNETFDEAVASCELPLLVDFWAEWCGPCRMLAPILEEIDAEYEDIQIAKLNVDECPAIAQSFGIMSIPTLLLFRDGQVAQKIIGLRSKEDILDFLRG